MALVSTERLTKSFGALTAVNAVTLAVEEGSLHSVIGPNGAGKTTLFNLLSGQEAPTSGRIMFDGHDIAGTPPHGIARLGIARSFQRTSIFPTLSLLDNVWLAAFARQESWWGLAWRRADRYPELTRRARGVLGEVGLGDKATEPAREISHGEQRQLELAIALAASPRRSFVRHDVSRALAAQASILLRTSSKRSRNPVGACAASAINLGYGISRIR